MSNSVFQNVFTTQKKYNNFNLGREVLVSGQIGKLIPVQCDEVVAGDYFYESAAFLCRFSPLSAPAMARFNVHFHTFYVPHRIITPESSRESTWEKFIKSIGKHEDEVPILPSLYGVVGDKFKIGSLADYLGYPTTNDTNEIIRSGLRISLLPFLAYQRIYQDFYRRDQLESEIVYPLNVGFLQMDAPLEVEYPAPDDLEDNQLYATTEDIFKLRTRNYERDYFTSALPSPQFGDEVAIGDGNINWIAMDEPLDIGVNVQDALFGTAVNDNRQQIDAQWLSTDGMLNGYTYLLGDSASGFRVNIQGSTPFTNEMGQALANNLQGNSITINEFRLAMQLQGIKEQINRSGTRYLEIMRGIYGVTVPDARLQRPIYLGGFKNPVSIGSVMQTSESNTTPQGTLTGQMSAAGTNRLCNGKYMFTEAGYLITIMSITPRTSYYGGMPRKYQKYLPEHFYLPQFDHLGEQEIYDNELYFAFGRETDRNGFGYQLRYAELKSALSTVHGEFRTTLDNWHVSRDFDSTPALNVDFIKAEPEDFDRIFMFPNIEGTSNEHFQMQIYLDVRAKRNMSKYSTPYTLY